MQEMMKPFAIFRCITEGLGVVNVLVLMFIPLPNSLCCILFSCGLDLLFIQFQWLLLTIMT